MRKKQLAPICSRTGKGFTLVELLVTEVCLTLVLMMLGSFLYLNHRYSGATSNKVDLINTANNVVLRISRDLREGRSIGDDQGQAVVSWDTTTTPNVECTTIIGSKTFPSTTMNPLYGTGYTNPGFQGWPTWADNSSPSSFVCSGSTLIVSIPIFDNYAVLPGSSGPYGFPTEVPNTIGPTRTYPDTNVETHIYQVVLDPDTSDSYKGTYELQLAKIPGLTVPTSGGPPYYYNAANVSTTPVTICRGIVGPLTSATGSVPQVFQYIDKNSGVVPLSELSDASMPNYTGIGINLELKQSYNDATQPKYLAFKSECYLRNNALATSVGAPASAGGS